VMVGSFVPEGTAIGDWIIRQARGTTAFYDIDTPVTLAKLDRGETEYLSRELVQAYDFYFSFTGGPILLRLERRYRALAARVLYCSVDPELYFPEDRLSKWDLGYIGTYSPDRQQALESLLLAPARSWNAGRFLVAGPLYPEDVKWPRNVRRVEHLAPHAHRRFYNSQRFTLNITRADMVTAGYSPSVRLFEAAACGTPIISDYWMGLETLFVPGKDILIGRKTSDVVSYLTEISAKERQRIIEQARARVLAAHTGEQRAIELENYLADPRQRVAANAVPMPQTQVRHTAL
jgi:spore maturation protein CgeB